jgi:hypothetical protein
MRAAEGQITAAEAEAAIKLVINEIEHCVQQCDNALAHFTCYEATIGATV